MLKTLEEKVDIELRKQIGSLIINKAAIEKIRAYSRILKEISGQPLECMGYLLAPKGDGFYVSDANYILDQKVSQIMARATESGDKETINAIKKEGKKIVGLWHSHADLNLDHPSSVDENMKDFLICGDDISIEIPFSTINPKGKNNLGNIIYFDEENPPIPIRLDNLVLELLSSKKEIKISEKTFISPRYTLIVDNKGLSVPQLHYQVWLPSINGLGKVKTIGLELEIESLNSNSDYSEFELANTIFNRTFVNGHSLSNSPIAHKNFNKYKEKYKEKKFITIITPKQTKKIITQKLIPLAESDLRQNLEAEAYTQQQLQEEVKKATSQLEEKNKKRLENEQNAHKLSKEETSKLTKKTKELERIITSLRNQLTEKQRDITNNYTPNSEIENKINKAITDARKGYYTEQQLDDAIDKAIEEIKLSLKGEIYESKKKLTDSIRKYSTTKIEINNLRKDKKELNNIIRDLNNKLNLFETGSLEKEKQYQVEISKLEKEHSERKIDLEASYSTINRLKEEFYMEGMKSFNEREYLLATSLFKKSIENNPREDIYDVWGLAGSLVNAGKEYWDEALKLYELVVSRYSSVDHIHYAIGRIQWESNRLQALKTWEKAARLGNETVKIVVRNFNSYVEENISTLEEQEQFGRLKSIVRIN